MHDKKKEFLSVDPTQILADESARGRYAAPGPDRVKQLAESIFRHGQQQPIQCRQDPDGTLRCTLGFTRLEAVRLIREGFCDDDGKQVHDPDRTIDTIVVNDTDKAAFIRNVVENLHRNATSPVDDAHNQDHLRTTFGLSNSALARIYNCTTSKVNDLKKLLQLTPEQKRLVHESKMAVDTAVALTEIPEEARDQVLAECAGQDGKVSGPAVKKRAAETRKQQNKPARSRGLTEFKELVRSCINVETEDPGERALSNVMIAIDKYLSGQRSDRWLLTTIKTITQA